MLSNAKSFRILLFSGMVVIVLISGVSAANSEARPLQDVEIVLNKSASLAAFSHVGEVITYTYTVFNRSGYEMYNVNVTDDMVVVSCPSSLVEGSMTGSSCASESEAIEGRMDCIGTYVVTQADIDSGQITNSASVSGTYDIPGGCGGDSQVLSVSADTDLTIAANQQPSISLTKNGSPTSFRGPGEFITYSYAVENTGNVSLAGPITITDDMVTTSCPSGGLAPGDNMLCTASYTTTDFDVVTGFIRNTATVSAAAGVTASDDFEILLEGVPDLRLVKTASATTYTEYWELIIFTYTITNTGNVPIDGPFHVQDPLLDEWNCPETGTLGLGESLDCLGYYRTRHPLGGIITNCATVEGVYQGSTVSSNEDCAQVHYEPPQDPFGNGQPDN